MRVKSIKRNQEEQIHLNVAGEVAKNSLEQKQEKAGDG